ncbi:hypothetical protein IGK80_002325 [Enterococcus sp. DIV0609]|uniref:hypothetical protein n=1 Tax=Enterococcus TaxID=1350 RepID=UPI00155E6B0E|nr:hypothetical protein [Enterococcus faecalis]EKZ0110448.1 hypothetical protein [Enterococcus faecalis]NRC86690.1 hypothetical protein [Enterococcus faecalis]NSN29155.1 hypothetical protein [Enterococcus faecalis]HCY9397999.1 hypothetical protein [Enterococcus faecalis]
MKCENCGAEVHGTICEYCKSKISKEPHSINITNNYYNTADKNSVSTQENIHEKTTTKQNSKKKIWLWILGWLFIFPLPLTILLIRKKDMQPTVKYGLIAFIWIFVFAIGFLGENNNKTYSKLPDIIETTTTTQEKEQKKNKENTKKEDSSKEPKTNSTTNNSTETNIETVYAEDKVVNKFISEFNEKSPFKITNISKGNIRTKYHGNANGCYVEMLNANDNYAKIFSLSINNNTDANDNQAMFELFKIAVQVLDSSISDNTIDETLTYFKDKNILIENYKLGNTLSIDYIPIKENLSHGRIDISASSYK